jgi:beta-lactamase regulating signal transducer with metallopeptidase domain
MTGWAVETLIATTLLMLLVLVVRGPVRKGFGPHMAYALWLLPVARLLLPPLPESWREQAVTPVAKASEVIAYYVVEPMSGGHAAAAPAAAASVAQAAPVVHATPIDWLLIVGIVWGVGALAFLAYHLIAHGRFCRNLLSRARVDRTVAQGRVRVIETDAAHGPLAFGIFRKYVAFPRDFSERYDEVERDLALAHELGHHVRGDLIANWVALIVLAIHWFNPIAWRAFRAFRADQEMACDALVLAGRAQALRHAYGRAIVKSAHGGAVSAACHLHTINEVKGRLRMLSKTRKLSPTRIATGLVGVSALSLAALGLTASGTQAAERIKNDVKATIGLQEVPAPPAPAEPAAAPELPEAPEAPEAAAGPHKIEKHVYRYTTDGKKDGKQVKKIVIVRADGGREEVDMPDMEAIQASIPEVRNGKCGKGTPTVENHDEGGKHVMIVCSDRIAMVTADATRVAMQSKRLGLESARMGIRMARRSIENERNMSEAERAKALAGLDRALAEIDKSNDGRSEDRDEDRNDD